MLGLISKILLFPYWLILLIRNRLYNKRFNNYQFNIPIINVGNITVGGTGKTPHTEMLINSLKENYKIGVVSLGYKRKTKGYREVQFTDDYTLCGDEPLQIKKKFPDVVVAVCKEREYAIKKIIDDYGVNLIILDDAYQYRKIVPSCNILLINNNRTIVGDNLLPIGRLRDLPEGVKRADITIITKCPNFCLEDGFENNALGLQIADKEEEKWRKELNLSPEQRLYFSTLYYHQAQPVFCDVCNVRYLYSKFAIYFSGIAMDHEFKSYLVSKYKIGGSIKFSDHKNFSKSDIKKIVKLARKLPEAAIITTEKDSIRLSNNKYIPEDIKTRMFYLPIACKIIPESKRNEFLNIVTKKKNQP